MAEMGPNLRFPEARALPLSLCVSLHSRCLQSQKPQTDTTGGAVMKPGRCPGDKDVGPGRTTTPRLGQRAFPPNSTKQWEAMPEAGAGRLLQ